jgi:hypothetical protein
MARPSQLKHFVLVFVWFGPSAHISIIGQPAGILDYSVIDLSCVCVWRAKKGVASFVTRPRRRG